MRVLRCVGQTLALATLGLAFTACGNVQIGTSRAPVDINTPRSTVSPSGTISRVQSESSRSAFVGASSVIVKSGDTVYALSRRHRVPVPAIITANDLAAPYLLNVGQRIELPRGRQHRVSQGDTLYAIAQQYDVGVYEVARINDVDPPYTIKLGEILVIPEADAPRRTSKTAPVASAPKPAPSPIAQKTEPRQMERAPKVAADAGKIAMIPPKKPPVPVPPPPKRAGKGFIWPVQGPLLSSFGAKDGGLRNDGINIKAARGTPVRAAENGVVAYAGNEIRGFGNLLLIKHDGGYITAYAHNDQLLVTRGQRVVRGDKIATVGATGSVNRPQLHFEVRKGRRPQDPKKYLRSS
jgi:murein DD-endopeptidase MepM/ murein hydrolase activator NlpD